MGKNGRKQVKIRRNFSVLFQFGLFALTGVLHLNLLFQFAVESREVLVDYVDQLESLLFQDLFPVYQVLFLLVVVAVQLFSVALGQLLKIHDFV